MELVATNCVVTKTILNAADTAQTIPIFQLTGTEYVISLMARVKTAFAGVTYPEVRVGYSGDLERLICRQTINRAGDLITGAAPLGSAGLCPKQYPDYVKTESPKEIIATFSSTSGNFSSLSAGSIEFMVVYARS